MSGSNAWKSAGSRLGDRQPASAGFHATQPDDSIVRRSAAFDSVAQSYDRDFTHTALGRALRERAWRRLVHRFPPGSRVLELNCGTGEDAAYLAARAVSVLATDRSEGMLAVARRKTAGLPVEVARLDLSLPALPPSTLTLPPFDGAFSNFAGLNCIADLRRLACSLAEWLKPGASVIFVVMGPICLWEIAWYLFHLRPGRAFWRFSRFGALARIGGQIVRVYCPWAGELSRTCAPEFRVTRLAGLGVALPPSLMAGVM
ncbi:MAG: methyltransferase domain-containing protein, partial [Chloroflexi bacterium]|nr:methyltransferase domain-containing protein [Chloroflexota bacterium]